MPVADHPAHRRDARRWLGGLAVLVACSWARCLATGSPKVDESYPSEVVGTALLLSLTAGWALLVLGWRGLLERPASPAASRRLAFAGLGLAAFMLPMISNDIFSLITYGSLAARGRDVYTTAAGLSESPFSRFVGEHWDDRVCVYGPTTLLAILPAGLSRGNPWLALVLLRAAWFVPLALVMELSLRGDRGHPGLSTMLWLNPLWILEGPGQMHADLLGVAAVTAAARLLGRGRLLGGWVLFAVAVLGKVSFLFAAPYFWLVGARGARDRWVRVPALIGVIACLGVVSFAPFWRGPATIVEPLRSLSRMNPGGSLTEIAGHLVHLARGGAMAPADLPVHEALAFERATKGATWTAVSLVLRALTLIIGARIVVALVRRPYRADSVALGTGAIVVAALTLASHRFQSWYLLGALPFFGLACTTAWRRWWIAVVAVVPTTEFACVLPRTAAVLPVWVGVTTAAGVVLFLLSFRARYGVAALFGEVTACGPAGADAGGG
jgi:hypothetical protein